MTIKLLLEAIIKYVLGILLVGTLLFVPGTFNYWQGWLFMELLFIPMFIAGIVLMIVNSELLSRRLNAKENEKNKKKLSYAVH